MGSIVAQAEALRAGIRCIRPQPSDALNPHGMNVHIPLTFADGVKWLVRIRQNHALPLPVEASRLNAKSEAATYRALREAGVPSPQGWFPPEDPKSE